MISHCHCDIEFTNKRSNQLERRCPRPRASVTARRISGGVEVVVKTEHNRDIFVSKAPEVFDKFVSEGKVTVKIPEYLCIVLIREAAVDEVKSLIAILKPTAAAPCSLEGNKENLRAAANSSATTATGAHGAPQKMVSTPESKKNVRPSKGSLSPFLSLLLSKVSKGADAPNTTKVEPFISKTPIKKRVRTSNGNSPATNRGGGSPKGSSFFKSPSPRMARKLGCFMQSPQLLKLRKSPTKNATSTSSASSSSNKKRGEDKLTDEQEEVLDACLKGECVFYTGGAGTGKSTLLGTIVKKLEGKHGKTNVYVTATTGLAACIVEGTTVHQFAGINATACEEGAANGDYSTAVKSILQKPQLVRRMRAASVLVIDEISMMSADLFEMLDQILQGARASNKPMGGLQVVLSGDFFQLPPVAKSTVPRLDSTATPSCRQWLSGSGSSTFGGNGNGSTGATSSSSSCTAAGASSSGGGGGGVRPVSVNAQGYATFAPVGSTTATATTAGPSQAQSQPYSQSQYRGYDNTQALSQQQQQLQRQSSTSTGTAGASSSSASSSGSSKQPNKTTRFCFQSPVWNKLVQSTFVLSTVFRQRESAFIGLLNDIRWGNFKDETRRSFQPCVGRKLSCSDGILPTRIYTHRKDVDDLNSKELQQLPGECVEYKAVDSGDPVFLRSLQMNSPAKQTLKLKVGAQVILVKTIDSKEGLVNGARGVVIKFTRDTKRPVVRFSDGVERSLSCENFSMSMGGRVVAQRSQIPLDLAWGISVHKSQGMTVDKAILHLRKVFEFGQSYVALSRVRSIDGLSLDSALTASQVKAHPDVIAFYQELTRKQQQRVQNRCRQQQSNSSSSIR